MLLILLRLLKFWQSVSINSSNQKCLILQKLLQTWRPTVKATATTLRKAYDSQPVINHF